MQNNGIHYLLQGFTLIMQPGLKRFVFIPLLINTFLFIGLFILTHYFFNQINHWILSFLPSWLQWIGGILWVVFFIGFFLIAIYTFVTLANLIAAPFNSLLAEKVQEHLTGKTINSLSLWATLKDTPRIIGRQFAILGYYIPRAIVLLLLFFIPIIQIIAALIWFLFNAWFMTLQYVDYPTDNQRISFQKMRQQLQQQRGLSLSFGIGVLVLTMIPVVNFIAMPAAVAGATALWVKEFMRKDSSL